MNKISLKSLLNKKIVIVLVLFVILGFAVRLYRFDNPIADWHSWRQSDTSAVSKIFVREGFDPLHPKYFDISNIQSGKDNPEGYRFVEFPIYNLFQASLFNGVGLLSLEQWGRVISIISSLISGLVLFALVKKHIGQIEGVFTIFFFYFLPFSIYYSRTILPDTMMVTAILLGIYFFDKWIDKAKWTWLLLAAALTAIAILLKPFALFFTLPIIYLAWRKFGINFIKKWKLWLFLALSLLPFLLWRFWMQSFSEGIPVSGWLFNGGNIRFKGTFFFWIFGERIAKLILGYFGIALLFFGFLKRSGEKDFWFAYSFLASSLLYISIMARGNVQHDYYQILIIPTIALFLGKGATYLISFKDKINKTIGWISLLTIIVLAFSLSWFHVRDYFNVNNISIVIAGDKADEILPINAMVIAPYDGDTSFLYHIGRRGWPAFQASLETLIEMGATHLVIAAPTENDFNGFGQDFKVVASSPDYLILEL